MMMRVQYQNGTFDMVKAWRIGELLASNQIVAFFRQGQWVQAGSEFVRRADRRTFFSGKDVRKAENNERPAA